MGEISADEDGGGDRGLKQPDYRFSLANERTFLAYVRTALAMMAAAVAVVKLVSGGDLAWLRRTMGILLGVLALLVAGGAYTRYRAVQDAMERGRPLPRGPALPILGIALTAGALLAVIFVIAG